MSASSQKEESNPVDAALKQAWNMSKVGVEYFLNGRHDYAEELFRATLRIYEKVIGHNHMLVATNLHRLASVLVTRKRFEEAEQHFTESLAIKTKLNGECHVSTAATFYGLAELREEQGRFEEAERLCKKAIRIFAEVENISDPSGLGMIQSLCKIYVSQNELVKAAGVYEHLIELMRRAKIQPSTAHLTKCVNEYVDVMKRLKKDSEAEAYLTRFRESQVKYVAPLPSHVN